MRTSLGNLPLLVILALSAYVSAIGAWAKTITIQFPSSIKYVVSNNGSTGAVYNFILQDQADTPNPMAQVLVTINETIDDSTVTYKNAAGTTLASHTETYPSGDYVAWDYTLGPTGAAGEWYDFVHMNAIGIEITESYAHDPANGNFCKVTYSPHIHSYDNALYQGLTFLFNPQVFQTQSMDITDTYGGTPKADTFVTENIAPH